MTVTIEKSSAELAVAFEQEARRLLEELKIPGVTLGLLTPDGDHFVSLGVTSLENPLPVTDDTLFQIGSTTKTITSLTCSVLVTQGKLDLDVPIRTYLPDFKLKDELVAAALTVRDLLTHQGGFEGDLFAETGDGDDAVAKVLDILAESPQVVPLRGHWSYSNAGFYVAGRVIEVITGQTYEAAVTELVLKPLGMDTTFFFPGQVMTYRFATGHNKMGDQMVIQRPWMMMRSGVPAGSRLSSTVRDMAKYAHYIMSGTLPEQATEPESIADGQGQPAGALPLATLDRSHLWAPQRTVGITPIGFPGEQGEIGQSWFIHRYAQTTLIGHGGSTLGQQAGFWISPDRKVGFVAMTNASSGNVMIQKLSTWIKRELLGLIDSEHPEYQVSADALKDVEGNYLIIGQPLSITARAEGNRLILAYPKPGAANDKRDIPLRFIGPDRALVDGGDLDGTGVQFLRASDGKVDFMRLSVRLFPLERRGTDDALPLTVL